MNQTFKVNEISWEEGSLELASIRHEVFILEQNVPEDLEWDGVDCDCIHVIARDQAGRPIGTGRLLPDGHIGRLAVLKPWRNKGVGAEILKLLVSFAIGRKYQNIVLHAQTNAVGFYLKYDFISDGDKFMEAGIPHQKMYLRRT